MGLEPFRQLMNAARSRDVPKILETPKGDDGGSPDRANLAVLRGLRGAGRGMGREACSGRVGHPPEPRGPRGPADSGPRARSAELRVLGGPRGDSGRRAVRPLRGSGPYDAADGGVAPGTGGPSVIGWTRGRRLGPTRPEHGASGPRPSGTCHQSSLHKLQFAPQASDADLPSIRSS